MNETEHLEVARTDLAAMLDRAADRGESERAARYRAMLARVEAAIERKTRKGAA